MRFTITRNVHAPDVILSLGASQLNLEAFSRLINLSGLSYRRIAEILGVSELELEETLRDLVAEGDIEMMVSQAQERLQALAKEARAWVASEEGQQRIADALKEAKQVTEDLAKTQLPHSRTPFDELHPAWLPSIRPDHI